VLLTTIDVSYCAILPCFVHYMGKEDFKEELLCCINLPGCTTGSEVVRLLNKYFSEKEIEWGNCVRVRTCGVVAKVKDAAHKEMLFNHFMTYRGRVAAKKLPTNLKIVLNNAGGNC